VPLQHHELCFGCGRTNLFGLLLELERQEDGSASGRCFIKQDHQGADPGSAHTGIIAAALIEAMALAAGPGARVHSLQMKLTCEAPVGGFLDLHAREGKATATSEGRNVATATAVLTSR
jgi:hypothetical protein